VAWWEETDLFSASIKINLTWKETPNQSDAPEKKTNFGNASREARDEVSRG
jgi:hypothetical protein